MQLGNAHIGAITAIRCRCGSGTSSARRADDVPDFSWVRLSCCCHGYDCTATCERVGLHSQGGASADEEDAASGEGDDQHLFSLYVHDKPGSPGYRPGDVYLGHRIYERVKVRCPCWVVSLSHGSSITPQPWLHGRGCCPSSVKFLLPIGHVAGESCCWGHKHPSAACLRSNSARLTCSCTAGGHDVILPINDVIISTFCSNVAATVAKQSCAVLQTEWGQPSLTVATQLLLKAALEEPANQHFVLLDETAIPLYPAPATYLLLIGETRSRMRACEV